MSVFAKNYFGHLVFSKMDSNKIFLEGDIEKNSIPSNVKKEFEELCSKIFDMDIKISLNQSNVKGGPLFIKEQEDVLRQTQAESKIKSDDSIKDFMNKFDASLKEKSIKPLN